MNSKEIAIGTLRNIYKPTGWDWLGLVGGHMLYPVYVYFGDENHAHGVSIPNFPGCFSAADDLQDLSRVIQEAIELWCEGQELDLLTPISLESLQKIQIITVEFGC